jgi:hypothetical protein
MQISNLARRLIAYTKAMIISQQSRPGCHFADGLQAFMKQQGNRGRPPPDQPHPHQIRR